MRFYTRDLMKHSHCYPKTLVRIPLAHQYKSTALLFVFLYLYTSHRDCFGSGCFPMISSKLNEPGKSFHSFVFFPLTPLHTVHKASHAWICSTVHCTMLSLGYTSPNPDSHCPTKAGRTHLLNYERVFSQASSSSSDSLCTPCSTAPASWVIWELS